MGPDSVSLPPRRRLARILLAGSIVALLLPAAAAAISPQSVGLGPGVVEKPADEVTYVSIQGFHFAGYGNPRKPARIAAAGPNATLRWHFDGDRIGSEWFYDIDPLANGNLFVTSTRPHGTTVFEYDPDDRRIVWSYDLPINDTHKVTLLPDDRLLVANMREYNGSVSNDRLYVEDMDTGSVTWEWVFRNHYPADTDGGYKADWTHVNDAEVIGEDRGYILASPRNFDQVIVIDRSTKEIVMRLGADDNHTILDKQHNPDYLEQPDGTPTILVADSDNDRVIEYERRCDGADPRLGAGTPPEQCHWEKVWAVDGFNWPRDADRLPNGNTLVTDTLNHRVVEITPTGEVVWEFHATWAPYDAERGRAGSQGPTMAELNVSGTYTVHGGSDTGPAARYTVPDAISDLGSGTPVEEPANRLATKWAHYAPWVRPVWMGSWTFLSTVVAVLLAVGWALGELVVGRRRVAAVIAKRIPTTVPTRRDRP